MSNGSGADKNEMADDAGELSRLPEEIVAVPTQPLENMLENSPAEPTPFEKAERIAQSVDDAIVLANNGVIRWLGEAVAYVRPGASLLTPKAQLIDGSRFDEPSRAKVQDRVDLWLSAYIVKMLEPLIQLGNIESATPLVAEIARQLLSSLGVLDRSLVKSQVKELDQTARSALRKLGVRFGAFYLFMPALMKPATRILATRLWATKDENSMVASELEALPAMASSGRTSFQAEANADRELYRVAGFRICGERAVRVDIVERLADLIRSEIANSTTPLKRLIETPNFGAFEVTGAMNSLTGCSGPQFASILQSMGYVRKQCKRSELVNLEALATDSAIVSETPTDNADLLDAVGINGDSSIKGEILIAPNLEASNSRGIGESTEADVDAVANLQSGESEESVNDSAIAIVAEEKADEDVDLWYMAPRGRLPRDRQGNIQPLSDGPPSGGERDPARTRRRGKRGAPTKPPEIAAAKSEPRSFVINWRGGQAKPTNANPDPDAADHKQGSPVKRGKPANFKQVAERPIDPDSPFSKLLELKQLLSKNLANRNGK